MVDLGLDPNDDFDKQLYDETMIQKITIPCTGTDGHSFGLALHPSFYTSNLKLYRPPNALFKSCFSYI